MECYRKTAQGFSITELVNGAGLTKEEWVNIKEETEVKNLDKTDKQEIREYIKSNSV